MPKTLSAKKKLTRQERRDLDIEIGFIEGVIQRDPQFIEALQILGDDYTRRGKFVNGLKIDEQLARLRPDDSTVLYNLACSYALTKRFVRAANALSRALDSGYDDFKWMMKDPDLKKLRDHSLFKKVQTKMKSLKIKVR